MLQFGLSLRGLETMLARWVAQGLPDSVEPLRFGPQRSEEFESTWTAIRGLGEVSRADDARTFLETSCWVLPGWIDALADAAREAARRAPTQSSVDRVFSIFDGIRVKWSSATPHLSLGLRTLDPVERADLELDAGRYDVVVDGDVCGRLFRDDGSLVPATSSIDELPPASSLAVTLVDREGAVGHAEECVVWDEESSVEAFGRDGRRFEASGAQRIETVVYTRGGQLEPPELSAATAPFGPRVASALRASANLSVRWDDGTTWSPARVLHPSTPPVPARAETPAVLGEEARLRAPLEVAEVLQPADWRVAEDGALVGLVPFDAMPTFRGRLRTAEGCTRAFETTLALRGAALRRQGEWRPIPEEVEARDVTELAWRVFSHEPPRGDVRIFAGAKSIARWSSLGTARRVRDRPLGRGEPLGWIDSTRVVTCDDEPTWIARSVVDHGGVVGGEWTNGALRLRWRSPHDPGGLTLLAWTYGGMEIVPSETVKVVGSEWLVLTSQEPFALTVSYEGARLGSWWTSGWHDAFDLLETTQQIEQVALFARVAGLPILAPDARPACRRLAWRCPVAVARAWWLDDVSSSAAGDVVDVMVAMADEATRRIDEWRATQRELFVDAAFDQERSDDVLMVVGLRDDGTTYVPTGLVRMAALGIPWARPFFEGQRTDLEKDRAKRRRGEPSLLDRSRLELLDETDPKAARRRTAKLEPELARQLGVTRQRVRELVQDQRTPVSFAKRVVLASREFALASALHALHL